MFNLKVLDFIFMPHVVVFITIFYNDEFSTLNNILIAVFDIYDIFMRKYKN